MLKIHTYKEPELSEPYLIAAWPGIGNVGLGAVNYLREKLNAEAFAEVKCDFFPPHRILIKGGVVERLEFPESRFYYKKGKRDLIIFLGEAQTREEDESYELVKGVLSLGERFGAKRICTAAAAVAPVHHTREPRVWAVPNTSKLLNYVKGFDCTLMSEIAEREGEGKITGLNGLLLGIARSRSIEGVCLLGEIPFYLSSLPFAYPKASKAILSVMAGMLDIAIDMREIEHLSSHTEEQVERLYETLPEMVRKQLDGLRSVSYAEPQKKETDRLLKEVEEFLRKKREEDQRQ